MDKRYKSSIPEGAVERIVATHPDGRKREAEYLVDGQSVGMRFWDEEGYLWREYGLKNGIKHGLEYAWCDVFLDGVEPYVDGKMHGLCKQWGFDGKLLGTYRMKHGTGIDLWRDEDGKLIEACYWKDGVFDSWSWKINEDQRSVWLEEHVLAGVGMHGIERWWNDHDRLKRGYPRYWVRNERVTKRQYVRATKSDPTLPPFRPEDNLPARTFPPEIAKHLKP